MGRGLVMVGNFRRGGNQSEVTQHGGFWRQIQRHLTTGRKMFEKNSKKMSILILTPEINPCDRAKMRPKSNQSAELFVVPPGNEWEGPESPLFDAAALMLLPKPSGLPKIYWAPLCQIATL